MLETGNVEEAAKTVRDMKPPKRYVNICTDECMRVVQLVMKTVINEFLIKYLCRKKIYFLLGV